MNQRIDSTTGGAMIGVALLFDAVNAGLNLIPFLGQILSVLVSIVAYCTFGFWFLKRGVGFANPKRAVTFFGSGVIEAIPVLNILPGVTLGVALTIAMVQLEDKTGIKMPKKV
ncbi:MAG: hypothetical protein G01um101417_202 [Parcubacteria group bacterium Gr01-1014_17]|nr:MAG: hypothetical protein G01um101417_202 [Parcubacteria group bacterium Gr01-1014_17]